MFVYFSAPWCQPCKAIEPKVAQAVEDKGYSVHYVNIEEVDREALSDWNVTGVPCLIVLDENGEERERLAGPAILRALR